MYGQNRIAVDKHGHQPDDGEKSFAELPVIAEEIDDEMPNLVENPPPSPAVVQLDFRNFIVYNEITDDLDVYNIVDRGLLTLQEAPLPLRSMGIAAALALLRGILGAVYTGHVYGDFDLFSREVNLNFGRLLYILSGGEENPGPGDELPLLEAGQLYTEVGRPTQAKAKKGGGDRRKRNRQNHKRRAQRDREYSATRRRCNQDPFSDAPAVTGTGADIGDDVFHDATDLLPAAKQDTAVVPGKPGNTNERYYPRGPDPGRGKQRPNRLNQNKFDANRRPCRLPEARERHTRPAEERVGPTDGDVLITPQDQQNPPHEVPERRIGFSHGEQSWLSTLFGRRPNGFKYGDLGVDIEYNNVKNSHELKEMEEQDIVDRIDPELYAFLYAHKSPSYSYCTNGKYDRNVAFTHMLQLLVRYRAQIRQRKYDLALEQRRKFTIACVVNECTSDYLTGKFTMHRNRWPKSVRCFFRALVILIPVLLVLLLTPLFANVVMSFVQSQTGNWQPSTIQAQFLDVIRRITTDASHHPSVAGMCW
jgi:hypothetical protein